MTDREAERRRRVLAALERHESSLIAYATRLVGDVDRARDVVQETFLRLCEADPDGFEGEERVAAWLFTVCRNRALDVKKRERIMTTNGTTSGEAQAIDRPSTEAGPSAALERSEDVSRVLATLGSLPESQQEVIRLKFQHGLSYKEIASVTDQSTGNVGWLLHVGLKSLREKLAGETVGTLEESA